jgi:hypothetical protein
MQQEQLFYNNFGRTGNELDNNSFLKDKLNDYPYFGLAHFYLLKDAFLNKTNFVNVASKTALFFNNPFYLQAQIQPEIEKEIVKENTFENIKEETDINKQVDIVKAEPTVEKPNNPEVSTQKEELLFEPLYTTDYFASQGIKLSEVVLGDDKLGKQLKSFTSWLKTMKKVHPDKLPMVTALVETTVQNQAAKSNLEEEIVTEAMAEAFVQQDKLVRAIDTYKKLSLLYPAKSAYFAAKIETLK